MQALSSQIFERETLWNSTLRVERRKWRNADEREARRTRSKVIARKLSSAGMMARGRKPRDVTARDSVQSRSPSAKCCELYASLHDRFRLEVRILFHPMRTWKLAAWVTAIIAGMRVVGGAGEGVRLEGGTGVQGRGRGLRTVTKRT